MFTVASIAAVIVVCNYYLAGDQDIVTDTDRLNRTDMYIVVNLDIVTNFKTSLP